MSDISPYIESSRWKASETHFQQTYTCEWFLVLDWITHQRVPWEQNIRYIYLPSLQLSIIMWLSHLLTSFSSQRNRYLFPKYRVTHIWAERFRYGYTPCNISSIKEGQCPQVLSKYWIVCKVTVWLWTKI
jgi:hypothetical protein